MEERDLTPEDIPFAYPLCFNHACEDRATCMHYQAGRLATDGRHYAYAVLPSAWSDGHCACYHEKRLLTYAWGFSHLYDHVPSYLRSTARQTVSDLFSSGNGPYYRYHHGQSRLNPEQQALVLDTVSRFGDVKGIRFDHYVTDWDFSY